MSHSKLLIGCPRSPWFYFCAFKMSHLTTKWSLQRLELKSFAWNKNSASYLSSYLWPMCDFPWKLKRILLRTFYEILRGGMEHPARTPDLPLAGVLYFQKFPSMPTSCSVTSWPTLLMQLNLFKFSKILSCYRHLTEFWTFSIRLLVL